MDDGGRRLMIDEGGELSSITYSRRDVRRSDTIARLLFHHAVHRDRRSRRRLAALMANVEFDRVSQKGCGALALLPFGLMFTMGLASVRPHGWMAPAGVILAAILAWPLDGALRRRAARRAIDEGTLSIMDKVEEPARPGTGAPIFRCRWRWPRPGAGNWEAIHPTADWDLVHQADSLWYWEMPHPDAAGRPGQRSPIFIGLVRRERSGAATLLAPADRVLVPDHTE